MKIRKKQCSITKKLLTVVVVPALFSVSSEAVRINTLLDYEYGKLLDYADINGDHHITEKKTVVGDFRARDVSDFSDDAQIAHNLLVKDGEKSAT